jgi:putative SOS response-associated peptidase YedK
VPPNCPPRYNLAPTEDALVVRYNPGDGGRHLDLLRWGLIPFGAADRKRAAKMINTRGERLRFPSSDEELVNLVDEAFGRRRCIIPAEGFYEWKELDAKTKQPFAIVPTDGRLFAFAGLWDRWRDPETKAIVRTFSILTGRPNEVVEPIHIRMPVILDEDNWAKWLGDEPATDTELKSIASQPFPAERMRAYPISARVNSVKFDDEAILAPL